MEIQNISVDKLHENDLNPRKNIGDISELTESIKKNGIMQNLIVVPATGGYYGDYYIVAGHRRYAAAKAAGLTELPCVIRDMTEQEQLAAMLIENMQRESLTVPEQAQGMQLMFDMGETVAGIQEKTGFGETSVRKRLKIAKLPKEVLEEKGNKQITLEDWTAAAEIKDEELRKRVAGALGTSQFNWEVNRAKDKIKERENIEKIKELLSDFAFEITEEESKDRDKYQYIEWYTNPQRVIVPEDADEVRYFYAQKYGNNVYLYKERDDSEEDSVAAESSQEREELDKKAARQQALREATKRAYELRQAFVKRVKADADNIKDIIAYWFHIIIQGDEDYVYGSDIKEILNIHPDSQVTLSDIDTALSDMNVYQVIWQYAKRNAFVDGETMGYYDFDGEYEDNEELTEYYEVLCRLGYEMSDEEKALRDGTYEPME